MACDAGPGAGHPAGHRGRGGRGDARQAILARPQPQGGMGVLLGEINRKIELIVSQTNIHPPTHLRTWRSFWVSQERIRRSATKRIGVCLNVWGSESQKQKSSFLLKMGEICQIRLGILRYSPGPTGPAQSIHMLPGASLGCPVALRWPTRPLLAFLGLLELDTSAGSQVYNHSGIQ